MNVNNFKELSKYLLSLKLYRKGFESPAWADYQWQMGPKVQRKDKFFKQSIKEVFTITTNFRLDWYYNQKNLDAVRSWIVPAIERDFAFAEGLINLWRKKMRTHEKNLKRVQDLILKNISDEQLVAEFAKLYDNYLPAMAVAFINEGFSLEAENWLSNLLEKFLRSKGLDHKTGEYFLLLTQTTSQSYVQEAAAAKINGISDKKLAKKYFWIQFNYLHTTPLKPGFFRRWNPRPNPDFKNISRKKNLLFRKLNLPKNLANLFRASDMFTWWQDQRKKNALLFTYWTYKFLFEAGRRKRIPKRYLLRALPFEFEEMVLNPKKVMSILKTRLDPIMVYANDQGQHVIYSGKEVKQFQKKIDDLGSVTAVTGKPSYLGLVKGRVAIVKGVNDFAKVKKGTVLLASMTRPEYTPVLHKAAAIVTDEGGITSHAAIISRELRIPTIIGTKIATKIFKDGDLVEVDAEKGIVRKLN